MFGAIIAIIMVVCVVFYVRRRTDHKRMVNSRTKHDQDTYYAGDELLRVTSAGDSTLRVSFFVCLWFFFLKSVLNITHFILHIISMNLMVFYFTVGYRNICNIR